MHLGFFFTAHLGNTQHYFDSSVPPLKGLQPNCVENKNSLLKLHLKKCHIIQTIITTQKKETELVLVLLQTKSTIRNVL